MNKLPADVRRILNSQAPKVLRKDFETIAFDKFKDLKNQLLLEFNNHLITQEIKLGPNGSNISGTLGGQSNLFAFIGFDSSDDPIRPILDILENIEIRFVKDIEIGSLFTVSFPEPSDIFAVTPMPWASGRSWAKGIEQGISGLGYLIKNNTSLSRSGAALQSSVKIRSGKYKNTSYISAILKKYKTQFMSLK
jgi:hypothetical protein